MKILVNAQRLIKNKLEGWGWFSYETLKLLTSQHSDVEFIFIFDRKYPAEFIFSNNIKPIIVPPRASHPLLWKIRFKYIIPHIIKKYNPDLFLSPDGFIPLNVNSNTKTLSVIHDLNFEYYPQNLPKSTLNYYKKYFKLFAEKATRIATVSEYTKHDIIKLYSIKSSKIDVILNGVNETFVPLDNNTKTSVKVKYTNGYPYFIYVGSLNPRKNIVNLLKAYELFRNCSRQKIKLILCGNKMWWNNDMETTYRNMRFKDDVIFTGRVTNDELHLLLGSATALVYVSTFEGFGLPILEAMRSDVPVITSNVTAMPEVAGNAAILVDPFSVQSISNGMLQLIEEEGLIQSLIERGRQQSQMFSWQKTTDLLWNSILKTLNS